MLALLLLFALLALLVGVFTAAKWVLIFVLVFLVWSAFVGYNGRRGPL